MLHIGSNLNLSWALGYSMSTVLYCTPHCTCCTSNSYSRQGHPALQLELKQKRFSTNFDRNQQHLRMHTAYITINNILFIPLNHLKIIKHSALRQHNETKYFMRQNNSFLSNIRNHNQLFLHFSQPKLQGKSEPIRNLSKSRQ